MFFNFFKKKKKENFWQDLKGENPEGIFALAPMADVTDNPFRKIISEIGPPDVFYTEFVSCDGLSSKEGREKLLQMFNYEKKQKPIVAQIFGGKPENYAESAKLVKKLGFNGVDINMGCPAKNILKQAAGSELINHRELTEKIIKEVFGAVGDFPVSFKTRIGYNQIDLSWIEFLLSFKPSALKVHLRTKKEMSKVSAHWELGKEIVEMKNRISPETILILNGDIFSKKEGKEKIKQTGADGVMIGRGIFSDPYIFNDKKSFKQFSSAEKIALALKHTKYFEKEFGENKKNLKLFGKRSKNFNLMKKFFKVYINEFSGAKDLRIEMMEAKNLDELEKISKTFLEKNN